MFTRRLFVDMGGNNAPPLKTYRITVDYGSEIDGTGGSAFIRYSQRINAVKPNLTDY